MKKFTKFLLILILLIGNSIYAEVEQIQMSWNSLACLDVCVPLLSRNLNAIKHANNVEINGFKGTAVLGWNPNYPFSYEPFRAAFAATGILIRDMRIRVRGTIAHDVNNFYLISNGDDARFLLIGPLLPEAGRYVPKYNLVSYPLSPAMKEEFLNAEQNQYTVIISGPLFLPEKYPRTLICEQVKINARESLMDSRYSR